MTTDDESSLTAFLDGALAPEQRLQVESVLRSDPRLSEHLRELIAVRDLVAGLSRPSPRLDLSGAVLARIERRRGIGRFREALAPHTLLTTPGGRAAVLLATAASLLAVASVTVVTRVIRTTPVRIVTQTEPTRPGPAAVAPRPHDRPALGPAPPARIAAAAPVLVADPRLLAPDRTEQRHDRELQNVRRLLDSPNLQKVFIITDLASGHAAHDVSKMLETIPRKYARYVHLEVGPDMAIDARHPGEASVFAVVVDENEERNLRKVLRSDYPFEFEETAARPEHVTLLADIGQVRILEGTPVADIHVPEGPRPALRSDHAPTLPVEPAAPARDLLEDFLVPQVPEFVQDLPNPQNGAANDPTPAPSRNEAARPDLPRRSAGPAATGVRPALRPDHSVILVWVVRAAADRPTAR